MGEVKSYRAGCKEFCGMGYAAAIGVGTGADTTVLESWRQTQGFPDNANPDRNSRQCWCSAACWIAKYPPLPAKVEAAPKVEVGQRYRRIGFDILAIVIAIERNYATLEWTGGGNCAPWRTTWSLKSVLNRADMTLVAPSQPNEPAEAAVPAAPTTHPFRYLSHCELCQRSYSEYWARAQKAAKPATAVKCQRHCQRCGRADGNSVSFDGRLLTWCGMCHAQAMDWMRKQSNGPVDFGVSLLHNPDVPELCDRRLSHSYGVEDPALEDA